MNDTTSLAERLRKRAAIAHVSYYTELSKNRDLDIEAATALDAITAREEAYREALREMVDSFTPAEHGASRDPHYGDEVRALGMRIGFGALMYAAEYEWRVWLGENGYPLGSEFISGPCRAVFDSDMARARQALALEPDK